MLLRGYRLPVAVLSLLLLAPALSARPPSFAGPPPPYVSDESALPFA